MKLHHPITTLHDHTPVGPSVMYKAGYRYLKQHSPIMYGHQIYGLASWHEIAMYEIAMYTCIQVKLNMHVYKLYLWCWNLGNLHTG